VKRPGLYNLLPALYRNRDVLEGGPLEALVEILEDQLVSLGEDTDQLYENWFIETCPTWVVPYIGDLLGTSNMGSQPVVLARLRPFIGNLLHLRRAKGTLAAMVDAASMATGWGVRAIAYTSRLATTQNIAHVLPENRVTIDLRDRDLTSRLRSPFDPSIRTVDVREPAKTASDREENASTSFTYHPSRVGVYVWRNGVWPLRGIVSKSLDGRPGCYTFDPIGHDVTLFNIPIEGGPSDYSFDSPGSVPGPVDVVWLIEQLKHYSALASRVESDREDLMKDPLPFSIYVEGSRVPSEQIRVLDLAGWKPTPPPPSDRPLVLVDPLRGRFVLPSAWSPRLVTSDYAIGSRGEIGAGPYDRRASLSASDHHTWRAMVARHLPNEPEGRTPTFNDLEHALIAWEKADGQGSIRIMDNHHYVTEARKIVLDRRARLTIEAGNGYRPSVSWNTVLHLKRSSVSLAFDGLVLLGTIAIIGSSEPASAASLMIRHCTLIPPKPETNQKPVRKQGRQCLDIKSQTLLELAQMMATMAWSPNANLSEKVASLIKKIPEQPMLLMKVAIHSSICGPITLSNEVVDLEIANSIVDAGEEDYAIRSIWQNEAEGSRMLTIDGRRYQKPGPYGSLHLEHCTVIGRVWVNEIEEVIGSIFTEPPRVDQRLSGVYRYSYIPLDPEIDLTDPRVARELRSLAASFCQPAQAISQTDSPARKSALAREMAPDFISLEHGDPGYCRLALTTPEEIAKGGEDGSEMGVYHALQHPQIMANLEKILEEYTHFGIEADIHFVT